MRVSQLLAGIASGYGTRAVQFICTLSLVPFFLREDVFGIEGYGSIFTILAISGLLRFFVDGVRQSFARDISRGIAAQEPDSIDRVATRIKFMGLAAAVGASAVLVFAAPILRIAGVPAAEASSLRIAALLFWVENSFMLFTVILVNRGEVSLVNYSVAGEVLLRTAAYFWIFSIRPASIETYFILQVVFSLVRSIAVATRAVQLYPDLPAALVRSRWTPESTSMTYSVPLSIYQITDELGYRLPILLANAFLGPVASGYVALVLNTTRRYVVQTLYSVLHPLAIPLGARIDPRRASEAFCRNLWRVEASYALTTTLILSSAIAVAPELIDAWLGASYSEATVPIQILLCTASIELTLRLRHALLVGQGLLSRSLPTIIVVSAICFSAIAFSAVSSKPWQILIVLASIFYVSTNVLGISEAFWRNLGRHASPPATRLRVILTVLGAQAAAAALSQFRPLDSIWDSALVLALNAAAVFVAFRIAVLSPADFLRVIAGARGSLDQDLLDGSGTSGPVVSTGNHAATPGSRRS